MDRWRIFGALTALSVAFLLGLFLIAEAGGVRLRAASDELQASMQRRSLAAEFREQFTEAAVVYNAFLVTGRQEYSERLRSVGQRVNEAANDFVAAYRTEGGTIADAARQLRYLAGMQVGAMTSTIALYRTQGEASALRLARAREPDRDAVLRFLDIAEDFERYEDARMRESRANWVREVADARRLAIAGTVANMLLVLSASLMVLTALRRHRDGLAQLESRRDALEREATDRATELNEVYAHLQTLQEQERSRLARGLHDELGGLLLAARMDVTWVQRHARDADPRALAARIDRVLDVLDQGIDMKRRVIEELRPTLLDNMGLLAALRWQVDEACQRSNLRCSIRFPDTEPELSARTAIALFRVVQEALTNIQKHANARLVEVSLELAPSHVLLAVVDDGVGIGPEAARVHSHGLAGMRHRVGALGGTLTVAPGPTGGTEVRAIVPRETAPPAVTDASAARARRDHPRVRLASGQGLG